METVSAGFDPSWILIAALVLIVVAVGLFAYSLHKKGVPNSAIPQQVALRASDMIDTTEEELVAFAKKHIMALKGASMKDAYWDRDDFMRDVGRVEQNPEYANSIFLDEQPILGRGATRVNYYTQKGGPTDGNITLNKPVAAA